MTAIMEQATAFSDSAERELATMGRDAKTRLFFRLVDELFADRFANAMTIEERAEIERNAFADEPGDFTLEEAMELIPQLAEAAKANRQFLSS